MTVAAPAALHLDQVIVAYGERQVIRGMSLSIPQGQTYGLIGLNGVGKTTLIKSILGLRAHQEGEIRIAGHAPDKPEAHQNLAYLPERFDPPWFLSGLEFLEFSVRLYGLSFDREAAFSWSQSLALDPANLKNRVQTYSKGMRQKLGLIATFMTRCPLLILDEPMSGLDPQARALVKDALRTVRAEGRTVFLSSHILSDMNEICDAVGVLHDGNLVFRGAPGGLLEAGGDSNIERAFLNIIHHKKAA